MNDTGNWGWLAPIHPATWKPGTFCSDPVCSGIFCAHPVLSHAAGWILNLPWDLEPLEHYVDISLTSPCGRYCLALRGETEDYPVNHQFYWMTGWIYLEDLHGDCEILTEDTYVTNGDARNFLEDTLLNYSDEFGFDFSL